MAFVIDEAFLPATLSSHPMSDEEFAGFCAEHPDLFFEMTAEGEIVVMPPTDSLTGMRNVKIAFQLEAWSVKDGRGSVTGSSDGFVLPNGARRSPDAAWTLTEHLSELSAESFTGFWHLCPDFVIELKSDSDRLPVLRRKMEEWVSNGAQLGWLVNPDNRSVEVFRPSCEPEIFRDIDSLRGEGPVEGFVLDLRRVWKPIG